MKTLPGEKPQNLVFFIDVKIRALTLLHQYVCEPKITGSIDSL